VQSFKALYQEMMADASFRELFEKECNVCTNTMRIFARLHAENRGCEKLALTLGVSPSALRVLAEAEYCDPRLVTRLCKHLDLPVPENCPKMKNKSEC
jgi:hypothetical protein